MIASVDWSIVISGTQTLVVSVSVILILIQITSDHKRRRREATVNYMNVVSGIYRAMEFDLSLGKVLDEPRIAQIVKDPEMQKKTVDLLARIEHLSAGALHDVFDIQLLNKMAGFYLIDLYARWFEYMQTILNSSGNVRRFDQFESLVFQLANIRKTHQPRPLTRQHQTRIAEPSDEREPE